MSGSAVRRDHEVMLCFDILIRHDEEAVIHAGLQRFGPYAFGFRAHAADAAAVIETGNRYGVGIGNDAPDRDSELVGFNFRRLINAHARQFLKSIERERDGHAEIIRPGAGPLGVLHPRTEPVRNLNSLGREPVSIEVEAQPRQSDDEDRDENKFRFRHAHKVDANLVMLFGTACG